MSVVGVQMNPLGKLIQTLAGARKPDPVIAIVEDVFTGTLDGVSDVIVGTGFPAATVNGSELEGPPPGEGLETVTWAVPGVANAEAGIVACRPVCSENWKN